MRSIVALILACLALFAPSAYAGEVVYEVTITEEWVEAPASGRFVVAPPAALPATIATYGPFRVVDGHRAVLAGATDSRSPALFAAMLRDYPGIAVLDMVECPGTSDDWANLKLGRMIRAAGIATHVPAGGSVRSGGVELFLAGAQRQVDDGAEFAVHSWMDIYGRQAKDFAPDAPQNRAYTDYYREMGMTPEGARDFYEMTNSTPFAQAHWMDADEMRGWLARSEAAIAPARQQSDMPKLAYLDLAAASY
ncbi:MAG: alpha/beta hydrolase [Sphingomonadales bacterium]|nr:alpha/beta hydrolase [Sphingomonadales bacterium]MBD3772138.1 alpha/beta hydrolase [Paracoccaceae bacterium]